MSNVKPYFKMNLPNKTMEATMLKQITKCTCNMVHSKLGILGQYTLSFWSR